MSNLVVPPSVATRRRSLLPPGRAAGTRRLSGSLLARRPDPGATSAAPSTAGGRFFALTKKSMFINMVQKVTTKKGGTDLFVMRFDHLKYNPLF
jgi:hypothetical protein